MKKVLNKLGIRGQGKYGKKDGDTTAFILKNIV